MHNLLTTIVGFFNQDYTMYCIHTNNGCDCNMTGAVMDSTAVQFTDYFLLNNNSITIFTIN